MTDLSMRVYEEFYMKKEDFNLEGTGLDRKKFEEVSPERQKEWKDNLDSLHKDLSEVSLPPRRGGLIPTHAPGCMPIPYNEHIRNGQIKALWNAIDELKAAIETQNESIRELTKVVVDIVREKTKK
jgi:hypothetical protein